jgi:hypothetical protein
MIPHRKFATVITAATLLAAATSARAGDEYAFPSASGVLIAASTSSFVASPIGSPVEAGVLAPAFGGPFAVGAGAGKFGKIPPMTLPVGDTIFNTTYARGQAADAYAYRFLTHALSSASFANYAADYYRLFTPGAAVTTWTERMAGIVDVGYGGAVDSWTAGAYYLGRVPGPRRRGESAPDLTLMPKFHPHPELEENPTFQPR